MNGKTEICRGYAYSAKSKKCITYKGNKINSTTGVSGDWVCKSTDLATTDWRSKILKTTTLPPPRLVGTQAVTKAVVRTYQSKKNCFPKFDWVTLEEASGKDTSLQVLASQWDKLMELFPPDDKVTSDTPVATSLQIDSVTYGLQGAVTAAPVAAAVVVATSPPTVSRFARLRTTTDVAASATGDVSDCVVPEITNALLSGAAVPIMVWGAVWAVYERRYGPGPLQGGQAVYVLIFVSSIAAIFVSLVLVFLVAAVLKPFSCDSSAHDVRIVTISICMATMCGCAIALHFLGGRISGSQAKKQKFMMVAVDEDGTTQTLKSHEMVHDREHDTVINNHMTKSMMSTYN